ITDARNTVGAAGAWRDRDGHYRDLRRAKGPTCPTRARNTSFSIVSSPIRIIAAASSSLTASPSRSRNDPSIPDKARSRQRSSRYDGTPSSRERFSVDSPRSRRSTTSRLRPTLQRCPGARPPAGTCPMESVDGLRPPSLPTGPTKAADDSRKLSFMRAIPSRFQWTMWCPKKPGPAHGEAYGQAKDAVGDAARSVQEHAAPLEEFLRNTIESRPYTSVAVALSLGWFIGRMGVRSDY